jgi:hypothetical protein
MDGRRAKIERKIQESCAKKSMGRLKWQFCTYHREKPASWNPPQFYHKKLGINQKCMQREKVSGAFAYGKLYPSKDCVDRLSTWRWKKIPKRSWTNLPRTVVNTATVLYYVMPFDFTFTLTVMRNGPKFEKR